MKTKILLILFATLLLSAFNTTNHKITIYMIGDSTMANKPLAGDNPERGWGQMLGGFLDSRYIRIDNHAANGRSSKSFIDEGRWQKVLDKLNPGDYVFIQFGHNDEKPDEARHTEPGSTFDENLRRFVTETRAKGANPVLFNSIVRRNFGKSDASLAIASDDAVYKENPDKPRIPSENSMEKEGTILIDTHGKYLDSPRNVAKELNVPFVDMNKLSHNYIEGLGPETSKKLFVWIAPNAILAIPQGREDNTHLNIYGARILAGMTIDRIAEAVPALKPFVCHYDFVVAKDGSGDFFTIKEAIDAVPDFRKSKRTTILIRAGEYKEKIIVPESKINVSLTGEDETIITNNDYASKPNCFGENMGTSGSSTIYIYAPDFYAENITFTNTAGKVGQAVACFVAADRVYFKNCRFLGNQDTLYTYGKKSRQYYENCYIEGTIDFIFGWSTALFNNCTIKSLDNGYITAPSTDPGQKYGYVFMNCKLIADERVSEVYLGRPWRPEAQSVFIHCNLGKHICPEGWHNWKKPEAEKTTFFAEYQNSGEGADISKRVSWSHQLKNLKGYSVEEVLSGDDGWNPAKNGNSIVEIKR